MTLTAGQLAIIHDWHSDFYQRVLWAQDKVIGPAPEFTSWWRSVSDNAALANAAEDSQHLIGCALDYKPNGEFAYALKRTGIIVVETSTHHHAQLWPASMEAVNTVAPELAAEVRRLRTGRGEKA